MTNESATPQHYRNRQNVVLNHDEPYIWKVTAQGEDANVVRYTESGSSTWRERQKPYAPSLQTDQSRSGHRNSGKMEQLFLN